MPHQQRTRARVLRYETCRREAAQAASRRPWHLYRNTILDTVSKDRALSRTGSMRWRHGGNPSQDAADHRLRLRPVGSVAQRSDAGLLDRLAGKTSEAGLESPFQTPLAAPWRGTERVRSHRSEHVAELQRSAVGGDCGVWFMCRTWRSEAKPALPVRRLATHVRPATRSSAYLQA